MLKTYCDGLVSRIFAVFFVAQIFHGAMSDGVFSFGPFCFCWRSRSEVVSNVAGGPA